MKLWSNAGFSLPEVMVSVALVGGIGLVTMNLMQRNSANQSNLKFQTDINRAISQIQTHINSEGRCTQMFNGKVRASSVAPGSVGTYSDLTVTHDGKTLEIIRDNMNYEGYRIPQGGIQLTRSNYGLSFTDLVLTFEVLNNSASNRGSMFDPADQHLRDRVVKRISFVADTTDGNNVIGDSIKGCGPVVSDTDLNAKRFLCESLGSSGATWDAGAGLCRLRDFRCPDGQVPSVMTSLGRLECTPFNNKIDPAQIFHMNSNFNCPNGNRVSVVQAPDGKFQVRCQGPTP